MWEQKQIFMCMQPKIKQKILFIKKFSILMQDDFLIIIKCVICLYVFSFPQTFFIVLKLSASV